MTTITNTELRIIRALKNCRFLPGSFDKKLSNEFPLKGVSPLQRYWCYKLGYKYRKQINNPELTRICKEFLDNNAEPISRKEAAKIIRKAVKNAKLSA